MLIESGVLLIIPAIAAALVGLFYLPSIKTNINFSDEGYLWYGTQETLNGKVPIRDFRAYDPGRYYWCAIWFSLFRSNLLSLRIGLLITQFLSLSTGLAVIYAVTHDWLVTSLAGFLMVAWMFPLHKQVDILLSVTTPLIAVLLVDNPFYSQYLISGIYIGICLFFGLNHGIYAGSALSLLILIMGFSGHGLMLTDALAWYATGLILGILPITAFFIFVPRLFNVYWQKKIRRIFKRGTSNLPLPIPWLWKANPPQLAHLDKGSQLVIKLLFTFMPAIYVAVFLTVTLGNPPEPNKDWALLAIASCGLFYLHHAFSRADLGHLSQSIAPFLMFTAILLSYLSPLWLSIFMLLFIAISIKYIYLAIYSLPTHFFKHPHLEKFTVGDTTFFLSAQHAHYLTSLRNLIDKYSSPGETVLLLPDLITLYPMLQRVPAVYDIFSVYPATTAEETQMIDELIKHGVKFALIKNSPLDSREDLRFSHTHPRVWQYLNREFQLLRDEGIPPDHYAFIKVTDI